MNDVVNFLKKHNNFLLLTHRRPDGDTLGSAAALCAGLRSLGKTAYLWPNPEITGRYVPYTKPYFAPEDYRPDAAVAVDIASKSLIPEQWKIPVHLRIDHHPDAGRDELFAELNYTDPSAAACGEVIQELLETLGVTLTKEIAAALYVAIATDTGCFRYSNTTAKTHRLTAKLMETGISAYAVNNEIFAKSKERLAVEAAVAANIHYCAGGRAAVAYLSLADRGGAAEDDLENLAGLPQGIKGVEVALLLREEKDGWRVSCRSKEPYAANKICGVFGGGGHDRAAGAEIEGTMLPEEACKRAFAALWGIYPDLQC
ncbi:MAG: bifunctional oligoribonuclease/PAP phosphatase NrnA [Oscillospiraceae bacterium]|nr:bifunctional oligoribonuclease/PAP phosphatase NrnA [Oscillospiraceae bacterium]